MEDYDGFDPQRQRTATSMRSPDLQVILPGRTGKAQVRLAAAGRLRSAVALELVSGKVWALPIAVQPARGTRRCNGTGHPEWVRCLGPRAGAEFHHACGREELPRCWADSETRPQGPLAACDFASGLAPCVRRRGGAAGWTLSPGTTPPTA